MAQILVVIRRKLASVKAVIFIIVCICMMIPLGSYLHDIQHLSPRLSVNDRKDLMNRWHAASVEGFLSLRVIWPASKLGGILFNREQIPNPNPNANRTFVVLVWRYWNWLKKRHVFNFGKPGYELTAVLLVSGVALQPIDELLNIGDPYKHKGRPRMGLRITILGTFRRQFVVIRRQKDLKAIILFGSESLIDTADAVLVHLQRGVVPKVKHRNRKQRWIFLNDESPRNAFSLAKIKPNISSLYNVFNWSMTYRSDADVPVPYGRAVALDTPINTEYKSLEVIAEMIPNWTRKHRRGKVAAVLMSNCGVKARNEFLEKLRKHVEVDVYGACSDQEVYKTGCPGHFKSDCDPISEYLFYLVLENTSCFQYLTEKVFYHAYLKGAIPVIFGPTIEDVESLLPPNSYLHADAETNVELLAKDINSLAANDELLLSMHMWRNHFKIVNEHGYFGTKSYHLCRVCEALNYNDEKEKIYDKELLDFFLDPSRTCYK